MIEGGMVMKKTRYILALMVVAFFVIFPASLTMATDHEVTAYSVAKGDTLWSISQSLGVTLDYLIKSNPQISDPNRIFPGDKVYYKVVKAAKPVKEKEIITLSIAPVSGPVSDHVSVPVLVPASPIEKLTSKPDDAGLPPIPLEVRDNYVPKINKKEVFISIGIIWMALIIVGGLGGFVKKKFAYVECFILKRIAKGRGTFFWVPDVRRNRAIKIENPFKNYNYC